MKLTRIQRSAIRGWLKLDRAGRKSECPFADIAQDEGSCWCLDLCPALFPKLADKRQNDVQRINFCPCSFYRHSYVVRVARRALARHGIVGERRKTK